MEDTGATRSPTGGDVLNDDPRESAARYRTEKWAREEGVAGDALTSTGETSGAAVQPDRADSPTAADRAAFVETAIQQAIRRGDFDDLPGAGAPLPGLDGRHDPDWWIRRKIETERLTGLGPPAIMLRVEDAELDDRLDRIVREEEVREALEDFNRRVRHARMQLLGGPPVVTATRDIEREVENWHVRRAARAAARADASAVERERASRRPWWRRRT